MKIQSIQAIQANNTNKIAKNYKQNNVFSYASVPIKANENQVSFKGVANVALRIEGMRAKSIGKKALNKAQTVKLDSYRAIEGAKQFQSDVRKIQMQAALMHAEAVELLENGDFDKLGYVHSDGSTEWEYRDFRKNGRNFEIIDYDDEDTEIRRIVATPDKIRVYHFDTKEIKHNIYEFNCYGDLTKFGYDATSFDDGAISAKKYYEFADDKGNLSIGAIDHKINSKGDEKARYRYLFNEDGSLAKYDEDYFFGYDADEKRKISCKFEDNELVSYITNYSDNGSRETFDEMYEFDSRTSQPKAYYNQGYFPDFSDDTIVADEIVEFDDNEYSAVYKNASKCAISKTAQKAFLYGGGYLLDGFSYYRKHGWEEPSYELRI